MMHDVNKYESALVNHDMIILGDLDFNVEASRGIGRDAELKSLDFISCLKHSTVSHIDKKEVYEALSKNFDPYDFIIMEHRHSLAKIYDHLDPFLVPGAFLEIKQLKKIEKKIKLSTVRNHYEWTPLIIIVFKRPEMKTLVDLTKCFGLFDEVL